MQINKNPVDTRQKTIVFYFAVLWTFGGDKQKKSLETLAGELTQINSIFV